MQEINIMKNKFASDKYVASKYDNRIWKILYFKILGISCFNLNNYILVIKKFDWN